MSIISVIGIMLAVLAGVVLLCLAVIPCYLIIGVMYLVPFRNIQRWGDISLVGQTSMGIFDLMMSFYWITLAALHIFEIFRREKE